MTGHYLKGIDDETESQNQSLRRVLELPTPTRAVYSVTILRCNLQREGIPVEYFIERNGKFYSKGIRGGSTMPPLTRFMAGLVPLLIPSVIYFKIADGSKIAADKMPVILCGCVLLFGNLMACVLRKAGFASRIVVNQTDETVIIKRHRNSNLTISVSSIEKIVIRVNEKGISILSIVTGKGGIRIIQTAPDLTALRRMADELSSLIPVIVKEEVIPGKTSY